MVVEGLHFMLSAVLKSGRAVNVSVAIMNAFVEMRKFITQNAQLYSRIAKLEYKQIHDKEEISKKFDIVFDALQSQDLPSKQGIFYNGQFFDAYSLVADIIRSAESEIVLIDNYIDDRTLKLFTKRDKSVDVVIYTKSLSKTLRQDIEIHNKQYDEILVKTIKTVHDRFLIIDQMKVYHFGASLKDIGKKWFAFSLLDMSAQDILDKL